MLDPLPSELLDYATPAELAELEQIYLAELADVDDGPALTGDIDPDNPPTTPGELAAALTSGREAQRPHLDLIDQVLERAARVGRQRIILNVGPRYGKTRRVRWNLLLRLMRQPDTRIIYSSYAKGLAAEQTGWVRDQLEAFDLGVTPRKDSRARDRWYLDGYDGGMLAAGVGSGITGFGADLLVVDDVIADDKQAQSDTWRKAGWRWFTQTAFDRLEPDASVVVVMTRWHAEDLAGKLLTEQPGVWTHIRIPTVAEADDPIGRAEGALLWPERYDEAAVAEQKITLGPHGFASRHQQRPSAGEGGHFKRVDWRHWQRDPDGAFNLDGQRFRLEDCPLRFITIDLAASKRTSADWTVAGAWAITLGGELLLLDRVRAKVTEADHADLVAPLRRRWLGRYDPVMLEKSFQSSTLAYQLGREGVPLEPLEADADKVTRAIPYSRLTRQHHVWLPDETQASWVGEWIEEHAAFPNGTHDDQVDVGAYAARVAIAHFLPQETAEQSEAARRAAKSAGDDFVDLMSAAM